MSSNTKKQCDDVLVVWYVDSNWPTALRQFLEGGEYRLLFCLNIETLMETLTTPSTDDTKILLVLPAYLASELLPVVHDKEQIVGIDLLCGEVQEINNYQPLFDIYPKLLGVYEGLPSNVPIIEQFERISKKPYIHNVFDKDLQSMLDLSKSYEWFKRNRESPNMLPEKCKIQINKDCFFKKCRSIYALDPIELNRIDEFERNYRPEDAIKWYSKNCFVFKVINSIFRSSDIPFPRVMVEYVVDDICLNLQLLWQEQQRQNSALSSTTLRFYRGLCVPDSEIDRIKMSQGNCVAFNGFLSTTKSYEVARMFARNVLCEIEVNSQLDNLIFADISEYSQFDEQEVLFTLNSAFFLSSVQYDDDDGLWKIKLIGVSENEIIENQLKYRNFTFDGQQQEFIGDQWFEFEQYDKCISTYEKALLLIIDEKNKIDVFYKLAKVYLANKQFDSALSNALDAHKLTMSIHPPKPSTILELLLVIAISYACVKNYDRSIEYHVKYLILAESYDTHWQLDNYRFEQIKHPESYWNGAHNSYFYTPPLTHLLETFTKIQSNNDTLAKIHLNIAILCGQIRFGKDQRMLKHFNMAKQLFAADSINLRYSMWYFAFQQSTGWKETNVIPAYRKVLKLLDLNHSQIIMIIHYAIARCFYKNQKYTRALHHLHRALKIDEQYSSNDELSAKILYMIGVIHNYSGRIDLALEVLKKSLFKHNTLAKTNPTNYYDSIRIANITEAIAACYFKSGDLDNCLTFTQISLEQYLTVTPDYLDKHAELNFKLADMYQQLQEYQLFAEHLNRSLSIQEVRRVYGGESIAAGYDFLSMIYKNLHQLDLAIASLLKALNLLKKCSSSSLPLDSEVLAIEERLVALYSEIPDYPSALAHSCEILHILEKTKPWCKQQIASIQNNIGWFYYEVGDFDNALISCQKSFELFQECFQSSNTNQINSELTYVLNSLGHIYLKSGDQTKALDYCQKSLQALEHENEAGQHIKAFADNYELLADIYMQYGRQTLSFDYYLKALQLYQQLYVTKKDHPDIQRILTSLTNINEIEF